MDLLIVDDDPGQLRLTQALLLELGLRHRCHYAANGIQAIEFLNRTPPFEDVPRPHLILLDVEMPGMAGCDVLRYVKSDPGLRSIPVIMISGSTALKDIGACYSEYANAYVNKPPDMESNLRMLEDIDRFWCETALLPE